MKKINYVLLTSFAIFLCGCSGSPAVSDLINNKASLPSSFNFSKLGLIVMATFINKRQGTMSTLYANQLALNMAKTNKSQVHPGELFALVTWQQQADANWFGANIPGQLLSVETVSASGEGDKPSSLDYALYRGKYLVFDPDTLKSRERIAYILNQKPSVMP